MAFKVIEWMFLGINMFLARLSAYFNPRNARAKMSQAKNIFTPTNVNSIDIISIGNSIISSAITDKQARVSF